MAPLLFRAFCIRVLIAVALCPLLYAGAAAQQHTGEELLLQTNIKEEIEQTTPELLSHFTPMRQELKTAFARVYDSLSAEIFSRDEIYASALSQWGTTYDSTRAKSVQAWLRSPAGKAILSMQKSALTPAARKGIQEYIKKAESDSAVRKRLAPIEKIIDNSAHSKSEVIIVLSRQLIQIANTLQDNGDILTTAEIGGIVERMRPDLLRFYRNVTRGFHAYALRSATDKQIKDYAAFLATDAGQWYDHNRRFALAQGYHMAGTRFVLSLKSAFDQIVEEPTDSTTAAYINDLLKKRSNNNRVIGVIEATVNSQEWVGYLNAETNSDKTLTILALNNNQEPQEQVEITIPFTGKGTYALGESQGVYFRLDKNRAPMEVYHTTGKQGSIVTITGFDEQEKAIEGTITASFVGESGTIRFESKPFIVRMK